MAFSIDKDAHRSASTPKASIQPPNITSLATRLFDVPIAIVTLVDANRQWFKSVRGLKIREGPREHSFCAHLIASAGIMVVSDTTFDARFARNPLVTGEPHIRFYAGAPLYTPDQRPGEGGVSGGIGTTPQIVENVPDALAVHDLEGRFVDVNDAALKLFGYEREELLSRTLADVEPGFDLARAKGHWQAMAPGETMTIEGLSRQRDGKLFWTEVRVRVLEVDAGRRLLALVRDISERKQAEERLRTRARNHEAIARLGNHALGGGSIDELLQEAVNVVRATLNVEVCRVHEHLAERKCFVVRASQETGSTEVGSVLSGDDISTYAGYILATGEPVIVADARTEKRFQLPPAFEHFKLISALGLVIGGSRPGDLHFGILEIGSPLPRTFTADDVYLVQLVANILAAAIIRRRTEENLREIASSWMSRRKRTAKRRCSRARSASAWPTSTRLVRRCSSPTTARCSRSTMRGPTSRATRRRN